MPETETDRQLVAQESKPDWVSIGPLVVIVLRLLGMVCILQTRVGLER